MNSIELLRRESELAFDDLLEAIKGVTEAESWGRLPQATSEYVHTDASIYGITLHIATGKKMYGSVAFRDSEIRWSTVTNEVAEFEPNWERAKEYLEESQRYWMKCWEELDEGGLDREVRHFRGILWPAWKVIRMIIYHDAYHTGQIAMLRYGVAGSNEPPLSVAEDLRNSCSELPDW